MPTAIRHIIELVIDLRNQNLEFDLSIVEDQCSKCLKTFSDRASHKALNNCYDVLSSCPNVSYLVLALTLLRFIKLRVDYSYKSTN